MRYFLVYRVGCGNHLGEDRELTKDGFISHLRNFAYSTLWGCADACDIPIDDRPIDEMEREADEIAKRLYDVSNRKDGVRLGAFHLYRREDTVNLRDIERPGVES